MKQWLSASYENSCLIQLHAKPASTQSRVLTKFSARAEILVQGGLMKQQVSRIRGFPCSHAIIRRVEKILTVEKPMGQESEASNRLTTLQSQMIVFRQYCRFRIDVSKRCRRAWSQQYERTTKSVGRQGRSISKFVDIYFKTLGLLETFHKTYKYLSIFM